MPTSSWFCFLYK